MIRVLIADDFKLLCAVIRLYLEQAEDMEVIDEAPDLDDALASAHRLQPDVVIMNDYLPPIDSAHAAALFRKQGIAAAILVISLRPESAVVQRSFESGVSGLIFKDEIDRHLLEAVRRLYHGERYLSPKASDVYRQEQK